MTATTEQVPTIFGRKLKAGKKLKRTVRGRTTYYRDWSIDLGPMRLLIRRTESTDDWWFRWNFEEQWMRFPHKTAVETYVELELNNLQSSIDALHEPVKASPLLRSTHSA